MRLAAAALLALLPVSALAEPRIPAPFTIVPLVELTQAHHALTHAQPAPAQAALNRAATSLARTQALAGPARMQLAGLLLMQVRDSQMALTDMRDAEATALLVQTIHQLRAQPHY